MAREWKVTETVTQSYREYSVTSAPYDVRFIVHFAVLNCQPHPHKAFSGRSEIKIARMDPAAFREAGAALREYLKQHEKQAAAP